MDETYTLTLELKTPTGDILGKKIRVPLVKVINSILEPEVVFAEAFKQMVEEFENESRARRQMFQLSQLNQFINSKPKPQPPSPKE